MTKQQKEFLKMAKKYFKEMPPINDDWSKFESYIIRAWLSGFSDGHKVATQDMITIINEELLNE